MVLADILSYLLFTGSDSSKLVPFLNNANMDLVSKKMKDLVQDVESEIINIQKEKYKVAKLTSPGRQHVVDESNQKYFMKVLKGSRFKNALMQTHSKLQRKPTKSRNNPFADMSSDKLYTLRTKQ